VAGAVVKRKFNIPPVGAPGSAPTGGSASTPDLSVVKKIKGGAKNAFGISELGNTGGDQVSTTGEVMNTKKKPTTTLLGQKL